MNDYPVGVTYISNRGCAHTHTPENGVDPIKITVCRYTVVLVLVWGKKAFHRKTGVDPIKITVCRYTVVLVLVWGKKAFHRSGSGVPPPLSFPFPYGTICGTIICCSPEECNPDQVLLDIYWYSKIKTDNSILDEHCFISHCPTAEIRDCANRLPWSGMSMTANPIKSKLIC